MDPDGINYKEQLMDLLYSTHVTEQQIDDIIFMVTNEPQVATTAEKLEQMINLLIESGDSAVFDPDEEGAVGFARTINEDSRIFAELQSIFPGICPSYLREFLQKYNTYDYNKIASDLSKVDYVKETRDPLDIWEQLKEMLPNADPRYLRKQADVLANNPENLEMFLQNAIETNDYPTLQNYLIQKEQTSELAVYGSGFSVEAYLEKVPTPFEVFLSPNRTSVLAKEEIDQNDLDFAINFLYNQFPFQRKKEIMKIFSDCNKNLVNVCEILKTFPKAFRRPRYLLEVNDCRNEILLQEIAFIKHQKSIKHYIKQKDEKYRIAFEEAKKFNYLATCMCCFDNELLPEECYCCDKNCIFCKECIKKGAAEVIGRGETRFPCFAECDSEFSYYTLQMVLDAKIFQGLCKRKQMEEVKNANIDGLETCPFCEFAIIPAEGDKIFKCENIECLRESCRECGQAAHVPSSCEEIETDVDVKMRIFIENKMTEALLRKCWKCSKQFYKETGCNKMTCVCGARMCYVCGKAISDYSHFGSDSNKCPLFTENLKEFHFERVMRSAEAAKNELGVDKIKFDPTKNLADDIA